MAQQKRSTTKKKSGELLSYNNYAQRYLTGVHRYTIAYYEPKYRDTMKTKEDWDAELAPLIK